MNTDCWSACGSCMVGLWLQCSEMTYCWDAVGSEKKKILSCKNYNNNTCMYLLNLNPTNFKLTTISTLKVSIWAKTDFTERNCSGKYATCLFFGNFVLQTVQN